MRITQRVWKGPKSVGHTLVPVTPEIKTEAGAGLERIVTVPLHGLCRWPEAARHRSRQALAAALLCYRAGDQSLYS